MVALKFAETHNLVLFLSKPEESDGFGQIIQALVDGKKVIVTEASVRRDLQLAIKMKKQSRRKQRKDAKDPQLSGPTEPVTDDTENVESVPTHSNDPLLSGEDRLKITKLMELCRKLSQRVLDLENTKTSQVAKITELKERVELQGLNG
ncbi:hypothetical protein Tco_1348486 [Tanacetum coccineum]